MNNRPYQVIVQSINRRYPSVRYFSDFKTAYSKLRYWVLHSHYNAGCVKYVGRGFVPIVLMRIKGPLCYRWFGKIRLGGTHKSCEIIYHHKPPKLCKGVYWNE